MAFFRDQYPACFKDLSDKEIFDSIENNIVTDETYLIHLACETLRRLVKKNKVQNADVFDLGEKSIIEFQENQMKKNPEGKHVSVNLPPIEKDFVSTSAQQDLMDLMNSVDEVQKTKKSKK